MQATHTLAAGRLILERDLRLAMRRWEQVADPLVFFLIVQRKMVAGVTAGAVKG